MPKENASYDCVSLITLDSVIRVNKKYYPQALLEECKYKTRKNKRDNLINVDLELDTEWIWKWIWMSFYWEWLIWIS